MLLMFAALVPLLGAIYAFRETDARRLHRVTAASVILSALLASAAALLRVEDVTLLELGETLSLRFGIGTRGARGSSSASISSPTAR